MSPYDLPRFVQRELKRRALVPIVVRELGRGGQAEVWLLVTSDSDGTQTQYVLKQFTKHNKYNSADAVRAEYSALVRFAAACATKASGIMCPTPICLSTDEWAYLMTYLGGSPLDRHLLRGCSSQNGLVHRITHGLHLYYRSVGDLYGDFRPGNVVVSGLEGVALLDPTMPDPFYHKFEGMVYFPSSVDIGYWLYAVVCEHAKLVLQRPKLCLRRWRFTEKLLCEAANIFAPSNKAVFLNEVASVSLRHAQRRGSKRGAVKYLLQVVANFGISRTARQAAR